jgi:hypothetical protein
MLYSEMVFGALYRGAKTSNGETGDLATDNWQLGAVTVASNDDPSRDDEAVSM